MDSNVSAFERGGFKNTSRAMEPHISRDASRGNGDDGDNPIFPNKRAQNFETCYMVFIADKSAYFNRVDTILFFISAFRNSLYNAVIFNPAYSCLFRGNIYPERKNRPKENYRICHRPSIYRNCPILCISIKYKNVIKTFQRAFTKKGDL